jgi:tRNA(Ile)-lysidine synthase
MVWTELHSKLHITLKQRSLLPKGERILIAVSGGQDSVCLLRLLLDLREKWHWTLAIAHCDHAWPTDEGMADHVQSLADRWELPYFRKGAVNLKETEAAAREWRYRALTEMAQEQHFPRLVTGHTQSDRAETLLYNLIRGAGSKGLQAMTWQRQLTPQIQLLRPLLNITRAETGYFCQQFQLPLWEDILNQKLHYARNRIRQQLIPYLQTHFNPQVEKNLAQTVEILQAEVDYLEQVTGQLWPQIVSQDGQSLNRSKLRDVPLALQRRIIQKFLQQTLSKSPTFEQIEALISLITAPNQSCSSSLGQACLAQVQEDELRLIPTPPNP